MQVRKGRAHWMVAALLVAIATGCAADPNDALSARTTVAQAPAPSATDAPGETVAPTFPTNGEVAQVIALDNNFLPQTVTVAAGTQITWVNNGRNDHNVVPEGDPGATTWGVLQDGFHPTDTYSLVFNTPGTYVYYCTIHGTSSAGMFGTIVVTGPGRQGGDP